MYIRNIYFCFSSIYILLLFKIDESISEEMSKLEVEIGKSISESGNITDGGTTSGCQYGVYHSLKDTLGTLNRPEYKKDKMVQSLLKVYEERCVPEIPKGHKSPIRRPFVVLESNHNKGKKVFGKMLADSLTGTLQAFPPKCLDRFANEFHYSTTLRRAYISLCNYAIAHKVRVVYHMQPIIVTGYWLHQASLFYARQFSMEDLPQIGSPLLQWPEDLLMPDMMFYINVTNAELKKGNKPLPTRPKVIQMFQRMRNPNVTFVTKRYVPEDIAYIIEVYMAGQLKGLKRANRNIVYYKQEDLNENIFI